ncbi:MAG: hypothetical protein AB1564_17300, partial [Chloroflexota bacterium]
MTIAIRVDHISKRYRIGAAQTKFRYGMLRDVLVDTVTAPARWAKALVRRADPQPASVKDNFI